MAHSSNEEAEEQTEGGSLAEPDLESIDLVRLLNILWIRRKVILWVGCGFALVALLLQPLIPNKYTSTASFLPPNTQSSGSAMLAQVSALSGGLLSGGLGKSQADTYIGILKSESVAAAVINKLHLETAYGTKTLTVTRKALAAASTFEADPKSSIIAISVEDRVPARAKDIVGAYLDELRDTNGRLALMESSQRRLFFGEQLKREKDALANAEVDLKSTEESSGLIAPAGQTMQRISTIAQLQAQLTSRRVQLASLRQTETDQSISVIRLQSEVAALERQLAHLQSDSSSGDPEPATAKVPEVQMEYIRKAREVKYHEALFEILSRQYEAARLDESRDAPVIQVLDEPSYPDVKSGPHRSLIVIAAFFIGLLLASVWEWLQATLPRFRARMRVEMQRHMAAQSSSQ